MRRLAIALAAAAASSMGLSQVAAAADMPIKAPAYNAPSAFVAYRWAGLYIGGSIGGFWGKDDITTTTDSAGGFGVAGAAAIDATSPTSIRPQGFFGGVQAGYNWQINDFLLGVEADANWRSASAERTIPPGVIPVINAGDFMFDSVKAAFLATFRARLGVVFNHALLYATGGVALGTIKTTDTFGHFGGTIVTTTSDTITRTGWTIGGGLEYAFANNWSGKIEYLYVDLGSFDTTIPSSLPAAAPDAIHVHHNYTDNILRVGLNYRFGYEPFENKY